METEELPTAISALRNGGHLPGQLIDELGSLCLEVLTRLGQQVHGTADARVVLAHAQNVEQLYRQVQREQLALAVDAETSGAYALELKQYDALRDGTCTFDTLAEPARGRTCYKDTCELLSGWLGIDYHEAKRRIADAHLLVARRTVDGTQCAPRFERLARHFSDDRFDPRRVLCSARTLNKLEPADQVFNGTPTAPAAMAADGRFLEEHAAELLDRHEPATAQKALSHLVSDYKQAHFPQLPKELGLFTRPTRDGVHEFLIRTEGADAELIRSLIAQADNPRTQAGAAARLAVVNSSAVQEPLPLQSADTALPAWLHTEQAPPAWAIGAAEDLTPGPAPQLGEPGFADQTVPVPERRLLALLALLQQRQSGDAVKTIAPEIIVHMQLQDLLDLEAAHGLSAHGVRLNARQLRQLLCRAKIIPLVLNGQGQVLDVGRAQRSFPPAIKKAILARDRGCIVPGCRVPPEHVEAHHYKGGGWKNGCGTSVHEGCAVCTAHHHAFHAGLLDIVEYNGLPHVILPRHLDPDQQPRRNQYWTAA